MNYLDSVALAKLRNLSVSLQKLAAEGHASGRHRSLWKGFSHDFAQHRPYTPGDELKTLDWKVYARQDRFFVREYKAETILTTNLLLDRSGSMSFSSGGGPTKWETACRLAMGLAYLILSQGDAAGLVAFDAEPREFLPPRSSFSQLELMDEALWGIRPSGKTDLSAVLEKAAPRLTRRSLVVLISDLLGDPEGILRVVKAFKALRHEVLVLQVLDPQEREFAYEGPTVFEGLEDGVELYCDAGALRELYRAEFDRFLRRCEATFHGSEIPYAVVSTDVPWEISLGMFLSRSR